MAGLSSQTFGAVVATNYMKISLICLAHSVGMRKNVAENIIKSKIYKLLIVDLFFF